MHPPNCYSGPICPVWHRPTGNKAQRPQPARALQTTYRSATQPPSPPAREESPTLSKQFHFNLPASPRRSPFRNVARTLGANRQQPKEIQHPPKITTPQWAHAAVACMAGGQPSALGTGCHSGSETSVGLPGQQKLYVRRSNMRPEPHHDELHTLRRETERRRHCGNEGWIRAVAESHCRHDMMNERRVPGQCVGFLLGCTGCIYFLVFGNCDIGASTR